MRLIEDASRQTQADRNRRRIVVWLRLLSMAVLWSAGLLLLRITGGVPPTAWLFLFSVIPEVPQLWQLRGPAILLPLGGLLALSATYTLAWLVLLRLGWLLLHPSWQNQRGQGVRATLMRTPLPSADEAEPCAPWLLSLGDRQGRRAAPEEEKKEDNATSSPPGIVTALASASDHHLSPVHSCAETGTSLAVGSCMHLADGQSWKKERLFATQGSLKTTERILPYVLFILAAGSGGHHYTGDDACQLAIAAVSEYIERSVAAAEPLPGAWNEQALKRMVQECVQAANRAIFACNQANAAYLAASLAICLIGDATASVVSTGETRAYSYREVSGLEKITDGSMEDADVQYLGEQIHLAVNPCVLPLQSGERILLCSAGVEKGVQEARLGEIVGNATANAQQICDTLLQIAIEQSADNALTCLVVHFT